MTSAGMSLADYEAENAGLMNLLAVIEENRILRAAVAAAGLPLPPPRGSTLREVAMVVAEIHGVSLDDLRGNGRRNEIARARQHFMWAARQKQKWSLPEIGRFIVRDHTTVIHGIRAHERRMAFGPPAERENSRETQ